METSLNVEILGHTFHLMPGDQYHIHGQYFALEFAGNVGYYKSTGLTDYMETTYKKITAWDYPVTPVFTPAFSARDEDGLLSEMDITGVM